MVVALRLAGIFLLVAVVAIGALWAWGLRTPEYPLPALAGEYLTGELESGGLARRYGWYRPPGLGTPAGVVLILHGSAASGERMRSATGRAFDELADREGFIAVYPDGFGGYWNDCRRVGDYEAKIRGVDDTAFLRAVVADLHRQVPVDPGRVFAFGLSNGGQMALRLALEAPDLVAGVAAVAASVPAEGNQGCGPGQGPVPVLLINGTGDPVNPWDGGRVTLFGPFGDRGEVLSAADSLEHFRRLAGHQGEPFQHRYPDADPADDTVATRQVWAGEGLPEVALITIHDGGHTIPHPVKTFPRILGRTSHDLSAAEEAWRFFQRQVAPPGDPQSAADD
jgi:polyhydroxybutyrate depolymerase